MYYPTDSMNSEAQSGSASHVKITLNTEGFDAIKIKSEPESLCTADSEHTGQVIEPLFMIDKNEYEFQPSDFNWTEYKVNSTGEENEDYDKYDDDDYDNAKYDDEDGNAKYGDDDTSEDDDLRDNEEKDKDSKPDVSCKIKRNSSRRNKYTIDKKKEYYFDSYMSIVCPYCNIALESSTAFKAHLDEVHTQGTRETDNFSYTIDGKAKCIECKAVVGTRLSTLKSHIWLHLPFKNVYNCKLCPFTNVEYYKMVRHIERRHFDVVGEAISAIKGKCSKACAYCGKYVGIGEMVSKHIRKEHGEIYEQKLCYICPSCGEEFEEEKYHKEHLQSIHQFDTCGGLSSELIEGQETDDRKKYRCLKCNVQISCRFFCNLAYHALTHLPHKCFKCRFCDYTQNKKWKVIKHTCEGLLLEIKTNPNFTAKTKHSKPSERKKFKSPKHNFDAKNKLFVCPKCGENFKKQSLWEEHLINAHNFGEIESLNFETTTLEDGESVTRCTICEKTFFNSKFYNFKIHAFTHMPYKIYKCKICEEPFNSSVACSCQERKEGKYSSIIHVCPKCGKEFNKKFYWNNHMIKKHDLREMSGLNFYKISDTESPNYKCSDCDAVIQESSSSCTDLLFQHATMEHMPFKCYKCSNCGEQSNSNESIIEHCSNCFMTTESEVASNTKTKSKINRKRMLSTKDTVDNTGVTKETDGPLHKLLKQSDINKSMIEHNNDRNSTEVNISDESKDTSQTTTRTIISSKIILPLEDARRRKKKSQSDCLEIDKNNVGKLAITSMAICSKKTDKFNKYSEYITYACPECNIPLATSEAWHTHISTEHDFFAENRLNITPVPGVTSKAICNECCVTVHGSRLDLQRHKLKHMPYRAFVCNICVTRSKSQNGLLAHIQSQHFSAGEFKCIFCDLVFKTSYESSKHAKAEHADAEYPENVCHICMKIFTARETLKIHLKRHGISRELFECGFCERKYLDISILKKHWKDCPMFESVLLNRRGKKFAVQKDTRKLRNCIKKILPSPNYLKHYRNVRSINGKCSFIRVCPKCGKEFKKKFNWNNHMIKKHDLREMSGLNFYKISDTESPNYKCSDCDAVIQESSSSCTDLLFQHATIEHMPFKCYKCSNCGEQSNSNESIIEHCSNSFITTESEVASNTKTKSKINTKRMLSTKDTVDNTGVTKETDGHLHKLLKQSHINQSMIEHSNDGNSTEVNISDESKDTSKTTTRAIISSKIILPPEVKKKTQSDCLEIDKNNVGKLAITSMAICSKKTDKFNKYSEYITYACPECNIPLATSEAWHTHISTEHDFFAENRLNITPVPGVTSKAICNECCVTVHNNRSELRRHKLKHMPYRAFICNICMYRSKFLNGLLAHIQSQHFSAGEFKCIFCDLVSKTSYESLKHTKEEHTDAEYPENFCHICMKVFNTRYSLDSHMERHDFNREVFECEFCERKYCRISILKKHWKDCHPVESALLNRRGKRLVVQEDTPKDDLKSKPN